MDAGNDRGLFLAMTCLARISDSLYLGPWMCVGPQLNSVQCVATKRQSVNLFERFNRDD